MGRVLGEAGHSGQRGWLASLSCCGLTVKRGIGSHQVFLRVKQESHESSQPVGQSIVFVIIIIINGPSFRCKMRTRSRVCKPPAGLFMEVMTLPRKIGGEQACWQNRLIHIRCPSAAAALAVTPYSSGFICSRHSTAENQPFSQAS